MFCCPLVALKIYKHLEHSPLTYLFIETTVCCTLLVYHQGRFLIYLARLSFYIQPQTHSQIVFSSVSKFHGRNLREDCNQSESALPGVPNIGTCRCRSQS